VSEVERPWIHGPRAAPIVLVAMESPRSEPADLLLDDWLLGMTGLIAPDFWNAFGRVALIDHDTRAAFDGSAEAFARARAEALIPEFAGRRAILIGQDVETLFRLGPLMPWLTWHRMEADDGAELPWECAVAMRPEQAPDWWSRKGGAALSKRFWLETAAQALRR
jgi:hypothetical protein